MPARALGWEDDFQVPRQFDIEIMRMMEKKQITPKVRNHVVREVAARMLDHCLFPTNNQYQVVASKVIRQFPMLSDTMIGTGYVSIYKSIMHSCYIHIFIANNRRTIKNKIQEYTESSFQTRTGSF